MPLLAVLVLNGQYYREVLLMQKLLPDIRQLSEFYVFQQDGAPAHRARETVDLLTRETPGFIPPILAAKQSRLKSGGLQSVVRNPGKCLQGADQGR